MADVFVSYARADRAFVRQLHEALRDANRDPWIDWEDIPPSAEWLNEIFLGIEGSDTFLFVVSPESVVSAVCTSELGHAVEQHKRIIPVLLRHVPTKQVPDTVGRVNWIDFTVARDFRANFEQLLSAIDTNLPFVKQHTRLLVRALEWDRANRDSSLTLRGQDLKRAGEWLDLSAAGALPSATTLQTEYISASRAAESRRRRLVLTSTAVAVMVALGLAVIAQWQRRTAVREREIAISRQLAGASIAHADADPELAVLLASEALRRAPTIEAEDALRNSLRTTYQRRILHGRGGSVSTAAFSDDGTLLVITNGDDTAGLWDVTSATELRTLAHGSSIDSAWFSPRATFVATIGDDEHSRVWRAKTGELILDMEGTIGHASFSPDERLVVTSGDGDAAGVWDLTTRHKVRSFTGDVSVAIFTDGGASLLTLEEDLARVSDPLRGRTRALLKGEYVSAAATPDGQTIVVAGDEAATVWTLKNRRTVTLPGSFDEVTITPDGHMVASSNEDDEDEIVQLWSAQDGKRLAQVRGRIGRSGGRAFNRNGILLVTARDDNTAVVWSTSSGESVATLRGHGETLNSAAFDAFGDYVVTSSDDGDARIWALSDTRTVAVLEPNGTITALSIDGTGDLLATGSYLGEVRLWKVSTGEALQTFAPATAHSEVVSIALSEDGSRLIAGWADGTVHVWDTGRRTSVASFTASTDEMVVLSANGRRAFTAGTRGRIIWNTEFGQPVSSLAAERAARIIGAHFDQKQDELLTAAQDGVVSIWDVNSGRLRRQLNGVDARLPPRTTRPADIRVLAVSDLSSEEEPDHSRAVPLMFAFAIGSKVKVWDTAEATSEIVLLGHTSDVTAIAFDPRSRFVATASADRTARVWDPFTGRTVAVLTGHDDAVTSVAFAPDGRTIITTSFDQTARIHLCEICSDINSLLKLASERVKRSLTSEERRQYLPLEGQVP
jgi:WD40 repeat protein